MSTFLRDTARGREEVRISTWSAQSPTLIYCFHCGLAMLSSMACVKLCDKNYLPASKTFLPFYKCSLLPLNPFAQQGAQVAEYSVCCGLSLAAITLLLTSCFSTQERYQPLVISIHPLVPHYTTHPGTDKHKGQRALDQSGSIGWIHHPALCLYFKL